MITFLCYQSLQLFGGAVLGDGVSGCHYALCSLTYLITLYRLAFSASTRDQCVALISSFKLTMILMAGKRIAVYVFK